MFHLKFSNSFSFLFSGYTRQVFECFVRCHLSEPEGLRKISASNDEEDDIQEFEEDDMVLYYEQLNAMGLLARIDVQHSVSCLTQLLNSRVNQLQSCLEAQSGMHIAQDQLAKWTILNEDIHWLVMITNWTLTQYNFGERDLIPSQVMS